MQTITKRYVLGRQSYIIENGELEPAFDAPTDPPVHLDDPNEVAERVAKILSDNPGFVYNIQDLVTQKGVIVVWEEGDTTASVKSDIAAALEALDAEHKAQASA
jgi:hypothetical protein